MDKEKKKSFIKIIPTVTAIISITIMEVKALSMGINGTLFALSCAIVGGLGGYTLKAAKELFIK